MSFYQLSTMDFVDIQEVIHTFNRVFNNYGGENEKYQKYKPSKACVKEAGKTTILKLYNKEQGGI